MVLPHVLGGLPRQGSPKWATAAMEPGMGLRASLTIAWLALTMGGGSSWHVTPLRSPPRALAPRLEEDVEVFTVRPPERSFVELAIISSSDGLLDVSERAALVGCDAIFLLAPGNSGPTFLRGRVTTT